MNINISKQVFNEAYLPYLNNNDATLIFYGGAGSGKSHYIVQRYIYRLIAQPNRVLLVVRKTGRSNRDSTFALFKQVINQWNLTGLFKFNESDLRISCTNGAQILFSGLDDVEKLKSITGSNNPLSDIWIEEASEVLEEDYIQLKLRLRGGGISKQVVLSFNPVDINHWIKKRLIDTKEATVLKTTYKNNKFLEPEYIEELEGYKDTDPYYYAVYCLGEWGVYGQTVFDKNAIMNRLQTVTEPIKQGLFVADAFTADESAYIRIWQDPQERTPYVIGADTAGEGSDYFAAHVLNNITGEQVAVLRGQFDEDIFAKQLYQLGKYYNNALIGIEANFSTYPIRELERLGYLNQYVRERVDSATHKRTPAYGFKTTAQTRPVIIGDLVKLVRESIHLVNDRTTLEEMQTFVRNSKGRPEAMNGSHDDLIMSLAIAYFIRTQQSYKEFTASEPRRKYNFEVEKPKPDFYGRGDIINVI